MSKATKASNDAQRKLVPSAFNENIPVIPHHIPDANKMNCQESLGGWISVKEQLPNEGGRYWCYVKELSDLGFSHYQWNCSWNEFTGVWGVDVGGVVTHWRHLPPPPMQSESST